MHLCLTEAAVAAPFSVRLTPGFGWYFFISSSYQQYYEVIFAESIFKAFTVPSLNIDLSILSSCFTNQLPSIDIIHSTLGIKLYDNMVSIRFFNKSAWTRISFPLQLLKLSQTILRVMMNHEAEIQLLFKFMSAT